MQLSSATSFKDRSLLEGQAREHRLQGVRVQPARWTWVCRWPRVYRYCCLLENTTPLVRIVVELGCGCQSVAEPRLVGLWQTCGGAGIKRFWLALCLWWLGMS